MEEEAQELVEKAYQEGWQEGLEEGYKPGKDKGYKEHKVLLQEEEEEAKKANNQAKEDTTSYQDTQNTTRIVFRVKTHTHDHPNGFSSSRSLRKRQNNAYHPNTTNLRQYCIG
jgi:hypothetical protein